MTADTEDGFVVAQANEELDEKNRLKNKIVKARFQDETIEIEREKVGSQIIVAQQSRSDCF